MLDATRQDLYEFTGLHAHKQGLSPRSRRTLVAAVRGFYQWTVRDGELPNNPTDGLSYPKTGRRLPFVIPHAGVQKMLMKPDLDSLSGVRDAAMLALLIGCGLRVSGLVSLNQEDIEPVNDGAERDTCALRVNEKGKHQRLVPMPDDALLLLHAYLGHPDLPAVDRDLADGKHVLFVNLRNRSVPLHEHRGEARRLSTSAVRRMIVKYGQLAGIPRKYLHPHSLRHAYGTMLADAEIDLLTRQTLMGHKSAESTKLYDNLKMKSLRRAVDKADPFREIRSPVAGLRDMLRTPR